MFIGEQTVSAMFSDQEEDTESESKDLSDSSSEESNKKPNKLFIRQESTGNRDSLWLNLQEKSTQKKFRHAIGGQSRPIASVNNPWEALVLFSVNLSKLNITMNMGNVMGNTSWLTRGLRSDGRISIDSSGHKSFKIGLGLDGSTLDAKEGIIGGII